MKANWLTPLKRQQKMLSIYLLCVGNDNDLREVTFGDKGAFKSIKKGSVYIDNTTASAKIAKEIYQYAKKWSWFFRCSCFRWTSSEQKMVLLP